MFQSEGCKQENMPKLVGLIIASTFTKVKFNYFWC